VRKKIKLYQIDAFASDVFKGNPAAVCVLEEWLEDSVMQNIAEENNLSETAFVVPKGSDFEIRWFTPLTEVDLCGHATLAAAFVLFHYYGQSQKVHLQSKVSGVLTVEQEEDFLILDFPIDTVEAVAIPSIVYDAFNFKAKEMYKGKTDYLILFDSQKEIETLVPNFSLIAEMDARGIIVSARGEEVDFVSRFFCPQVGINEDPVTGSAHTTLIPFWSKRLGKTNLTAQQLSKRGGDLTCEYLGDRVKIKGKGICYLKGEIEL